MTPRPATAVPDYVAEAIALGVDEAMIERLVRRFYEQIRLDPLLAPVFEARIAAGDDSWEPHLQKMCAFWSSVMLRTGRYHGMPMPAHARLPVGAAHFDRWLGLFAATAREICGDAAELFIDRARRIAQSLEMGVAATHGLVLRSDERLPPATDADQGRTREATLKN